MKLQSCNLERTLSAIELNAAADGDLGLAIIVGFPASASAHMDACSGISPRSSMLRASQAFRAPMLRIRLADTQASNRTYSLMLCTAIRQQCSLVALKKVIQKIVLTVKSEYVMWRIATVTYE